MCKQSILIVVLTLICSWAAGQYTVSLSIQKYPALKNEDKLLRNLDNPQKTINALLKTQLASYPVPGIFGTYAGYALFSNLDGRLIFSRRHQKSVIDLVITPDIEPIIMLGTTVHHWELTKGLSVAFYHLERIQDSDTQHYLWKVEQADVPADGIIPLTALVIFAKPDHIYVPTGVYLTRGGQNLILPTIYARKGIDISTHALQTLTIKHFFEPVHSTIKANGSKAFINQYNE
jgi:hypothetical protein